MSACIVSCVVIAVGVLLSCVMFGREGKTEKPNCPPVKCDCKQPEPAGIKFHIWVKTITLDEYVQAKCYIKSATNYTTEIQFFKDDDLLESTTENVGLRWIGSLQMKKNEVKSGNYICQALSTASGNVARTSFTLSDLVQPSKMAGVEFDLRTSFRWGCPKHYLDSKCAQLRIEEMQHWLQNTRSTILVTGKMGTGKTTFIRGITEDYKPITKTLLPHTKKVTPYAYIHEGAMCTFYDTPGLKDNEENSNDYRYLKEMVEDPDVLVFAVKMNDFSIQEEDRNTIANITEAYGWKVWKKAVFIFTFANLVNKVGTAETSIDNKVNFRDLHNKLTMEIVQILRKTKVEEEALDSIAFVPVGLVSNPKIPGQNRDISWIDEFWSATNEVLSNIQQKKSHNEKKYKDKVRKER